MWTLASANLTCDFIKTGLHNRQIIAECPDFFLVGRRGSKLFHKIALITCKGVHLLSKPNQILIVLIGLPKANLRNRNIRRKLFKKTAVLKNLTNFTEKKL